MLNAATYAYLGSSSLAADAGLTLQTSGGPAAHPRFFTGFLTGPAATAAGLLAVAEVARSRYFRPLDLASLDAGLKGLGLPHGPGALDAAARVVAEP